MTKSAGVEDRCHSAGPDLRALPGFVTGLFLALVVGFLTGCSLTPGNATHSDKEEAEASGGGVPQAQHGSRLQTAAGRLMHTPPGGSAWLPWPLPGKRYAVFEAGEVAGASAITVKANRSVSILRQRYEHGLSDVSSLAFKWRIDGLATDADLKTSEGDDSPVRIVLAFDGDRSRLSPRAHRLSELSRLLTGEDLPYATLTYVWSNADPVGTIVVNRRSDRIRKMVVESGAARLGQWLAYERDVQADFKAAFGEAPGALIAVALMTDTDNTESALQAWYGPLRLEALPAPAGPAAVR